MRKADFVNAHVHNLTWRCVFCVRRTCSGLSEFPVFFEHAEVGVVPLGADQTLVYGLLDGAAWLVGVRAGDEAAVIGVAEHLGEVFVDFFSFKVHQAEAPDAGGVDDVSALVQAVHLGERGGVAALEVGGGDAAGLGVETRVDCLDEA